MQEIVVCFRFQVKNTNKKLFVFITIICLQFLVFFVWHFFCLVNHEERFYVFLESRGRVFCFCVFCFVCVHHCWTNWDLCWVFLLLNNNLLMNCRIVRMCFGCWFLWMLGVFWIDVFCYSTIFCNSVVASKGSFLASSPFFLSLGLGFRALFLS